MGTPFQPPIFDGELLEGLAMSMTRKLGRLVVPVLAATALHTFVAGASMAATSTSEPSHRSTTTLATRTGAKSAVRSGAPKSPITFSLTSRLREGNLVVLVDGVPVFNEEFRKPALLISQTTTWNPLPIAAGKHKLTAKVYGAKGKTYISELYNLVVSRTKGLELRIRMKGDTLTVEPAS
jgi:hypothetical protein